MSDDELMEDLIEVYDVCFQFDEEEPIRFAYTSVGEFSLTLRPETMDDPTIIFGDGKGKFFKIFMRKSP